MAQMPQRMPMKVPVHTTDVPLSPTTSVRFGSVAGSDDRPRSTIMEAQKTQAGCGVPCHPMPRAWPLGAPRTGPGPPRVGRWVLGHLSAERAACYVNTAAQNGPRVKQGTGTTVGTAVATGTYTHAAVATRLALRDKRVSHRFTALRLRETKLCGVTWACVPAVPCHRADTAQRQPHVLGGAWRLRARRGA